jgi:hypothetical protein
MTHLSHSEKIKRIRCANGFSREKERAKEVYRYGKKNHGASLLVVIPPRQRPSTKVQVLRSSVPWTL